MRSNRFRVVALRMGLGALVCAALLGRAPDAAEAAPFRKRTLREGMSGSDVRKLQRYLTRAGFETTADGQFGARTARSVKRFEREEERRANGVVSPPDARTLRRAAPEAEQQGTRQPPPVDEATLTSDGLAVAPASAPPEVAAVIEAANRIADKPYRYGGGHRRWEDSGYDCSGSVSYALRGGGLLGRSARLDRANALGRARRGRLDHRLRESCPHIHGGGPSALRHERAQTRREPLDRGHALAPRLHKPPPRRALTHEAVCYAASALSS